MSTPANPKSQTAINSEALKPYRDAISRHIRATMTIKKVEYKHLKSLLSEKGVDLTESNLRSKISKGEIHSDLFVVIMECLGAEPEIIIKIIQTTKEA